MDTIKRYLESHLHNFVPSWLILVKDILLVLFSFIAAYTLRYNFQVSDEVLDGMRSQYLLVCISTVSVFLYLGLHKGVVRHTGITDIIQIVKAVLAISAIMLIYNILVDLFISFELMTIPLSVMIIFLLLAMMVLVFVRFSIRLFYYWLKSGNEYTCVMIYGAGTAGLLTKNVLQSDREGAIKVIGFIDNHQGKIGKTIEGIRVYSRLEVTDTFIKLQKVKEIILAINDISKSRKREILELIIKHAHIKVKEIPPVSDWINGNLSLKQISAVKVSDLLQRNEIVLKNGHVRSQVQNKRVLITGAAGSIGSELARQLCKFNPELLLMVDQGETPLFHLENEIRELVQKRKQNEILPCPKNIEFIVGSITDTLRMHSLFEKYRPEIIYHAAAYKHVPMMERNPQEAVRVNIFGTKVISDLAFEFEAERFVMISTDKAVNPVNVMGATKRAAEIYIQSLNNVLIDDDLKNNRKKTEYITTRFGNVLGSNGSVIPLFEKQIASGGPVTLTHPEISRYFMTIPEACRLVLEAGALGKGGEILLFDMGEPVKIIDLATNMIRLSGLEPGKDIEIVYTGLRPGEKMFEELMYEKEMGLKTHHPKIFIAKVNPYDFSQVSEHLADITDALNNNSENHFNSQLLILNSLKRMVPEYSSTGLHMEIVASIAN